jgi:hypothetical protein
MSIAPIFARVPRYMFAIVSTAMSVLFSKMENLFPELNVKPDSCCDHWSDPVLYDAR